MKIASIAFTDKGFALAQHIARSLEERGNNVSCAKGFGDDKVDRTLWAQEAFAQVDALLFVSASGIAVRTIAPLLVSKATDPAVVCIDEGSNFCIPLASGHIGGANELAAAVASITGAQCAVTTASDVSGVFAVDSWAVGQGLSVANPEVIKNVTSTLLAGGEVTYASDFEIAGQTPAGVQAAVDDEKEAFYVGICTDKPGLRLIAPCVVVGIGCRKGTEAQRIEAAYAEFLKRNCIDERAVCAISSIDLKAKEPGLLEFTAKHALPFKTFSAEVLNALEGEFSASEFVQSVTGTSTVCERAAVACDAKLIIGKTIIDGITFALGLKPVHLSWKERDVEGCLYVVGLGPGDKSLMTQHAVEVLQSVDVICGYHVYTDLALAVAPETPVFTTPMRKEIDRCREALRLAAEGKRVAMVCSGDAGVYGMAGLCMELAHEFEPVEIEVVCGVTAALSGAAVLGSPLTNDFCTISLSDQLTPWGDIEARLNVAASVGFTIALYNPKSLHRPEHLRKACDIILKYRSPKTICGVVRQIGRPEQSSWTGTLQELRDYDADMFCTCFIGNDRTRLIDGRMVTSRGYEKKPEMGAAD